MRDWYRFMDDCWSNEHWVGEIDKFRALVAELIGLSRKDCVIPKTSAGQGLRSVLNSFPQDHKISVVSTTGEFDSIDFVLRTYVEKHRAEVRWVEPSLVDESVPLFDTLDLIKAIDDRTDLVVVSQVFFTTGQALDGLEDVIDYAHRHGAMVLVDAYHAVGVLPFDMSALDCDFVTGGCYKYLRGGPGACYLGIHPRNLDLRTLDTGWFAKKDTFSYQRPLKPEFAEGGDAWLENTPPVLTSYQATPGLELTCKLGVENIRAYNLGLQAELREALLSTGLEVHRPGDPASFGAFVLVPHPQASEFCHRLKQEGISTDSRGGFVRFGPDFLNTSEDLVAAAQKAKKVSR